MSRAKRIYMDHTAGRTVDPRVIEAMLPYMKSLCGNPSSVHSFGQEARQALEEARTKVAELINAESKESIFLTSGATESNNMAIKGVARRSRDHGRHIITSSIEHMSVLNPCKFLMTKGFKVTFLPVDQYGFVNLTSLEEELTNETILVSIMYANGEIGTIQPIKEISKMVHRKNVYLHVDAAAANGQVLIDVNNEDIDLLTISSNDMYGPKGVGALYIKKSTRLEPLIHGGGQERGLRSGTENLPSIVGFGKAAEIAKEEMPTESERLKTLRDRLIKGLLDPIPYSFLNGHPTKRLPNNAAVRYSFIEGESILLDLDMKGVAASSGSACTAKTLEPSHVLRAIGLKHEEAHGSLLFTLGRQNTEEEVGYVISIMPDIVKRLREMSPLTPKELMK
ncbi:MAG: cysteine desulfurase [Candidatus Bathyarchaeota archaeon]|nr:cysteine desulfurase [Candidatus Bathyarchaeota archaeon]MDH5746741.1 cysteine desulfurase [Candidatus Bathyarchaeota archaeon]